MRIYIADDYTIVRTGLIKILRKVISLEIVGETGDGNEAWKALQTHRTHRTNICQKLNLKGHDKLLEFVLENRPGFITLGC